MQRAEDTPKTKEKFWQNNQITKACCIKVYKVETTMNKKLATIGLMFDGPSCISLTLAWTFFRKRTDILLSIHILQYIKFANSCVP